MKKLLVIWLAAGAIILSAMALWAFGDRLVGDAHEALAACVGLAMVGFAALS